MKTVMHGIEDMTILPPAPEKCPICATEHPQEYPHNRDSLYYQMKFRQENGRFPTWNDAMAHCTPEIRREWTRQLKKSGVAIEESD